MCLILFAHKVHPDYPLVLAGNRDEFYARPTAPAGFWPESPELLAGRDLVGGGTWLGVTRSGRLAAVANYRQPEARQRSVRSRGQLTVDFLRGTTAPADYLATVARRREDYRGFNLLAAAGGEIAYYSNLEGVVRILPPGIYGLSNALLDTPWPKVVGGKAALAAILAAPGPPDPEPLFALLSDTTRPADSLLPETGVGLERERVLSSRFVLSADYGTRASTVVLVDRKGEAVFVERSFGRSPAFRQEVRCRLRFS